MRKMLWLSSVLLFLIPAVIACTYSTYGDTECAATPDTPYCVSYSCQAATCSPIACADPDGSNIYTSTSISYCSRETYNGYFLSGTSADECYSTITNQIGPPCSGTGCQVRELVCTNPATGAFEFVNYDCPQGCSNGACAATCTDGVKNGSETDVDCGGVQCSVTQCANGKACLINADCTSNYCNPSHVCATASCFDGIQNQTESDVDCGGSCTPCANGENCNSYADCNSSICTSNVCTAGPSCSDGIKNGAEIDVDCGRYCPNTCANGKHCEMNLDCNSGLCQSGYCQSNQTPPPASCSNGIKDATETDVDCGRYCPNKCEVSKNCEVSIDCQSNQCVVGICAYALHCMDQVQDYNETGVDCGGPDCLPCGNLFCMNQLFNIGETDVDCGGICPACDANKYCEQNSDCASYNCHASVCQAGNLLCFNQVKDLNETDVDCGGMCPSCDLNQTCLVGTNCNSGLCTEHLCVLLPENPGAVDNALLLAFVDQWAKTSRGESVPQPINDERMLGIIQIWKNGL